jgi:hypothetical protein
MKALLATFASGMLATHYHRRGDATSSNSKKVV